MSTYFMKTRLLKSALKLSGLCALITAGSVAGAFGAPSIPVNVTLTVDTAPFSVPGNVPSDVNGDSVHYDYAGYSPFSIVNDTIPATVCIASQSSTNWTSFVVDWGAANGSLPGVTWPTYNFAIGGPLCQTKDIIINTGPLTTGAYQTNLNIQSGSPVINETAPAGYKLKVLFDPDTTKTLHINATVLQPSDLVTCFLTDSSGLNLTDCAGNSVTQSGSEAGRFVIVANKKNIESATNPGQFYFNIIYNNITDAAKTVSVNFSPLVGVAPHGKQAVHWAVFNNYLASLSQGEWDATNSVGSPDGADPWVYNISVRPNSHLVVTYHLEWKGVGSAVPVPCATSCALADQEIRVTGTVYDAGGAEIDHCTAAAWGFRKSPTSTQAALQRYMKRNKH